MASDNFERKMEDVRRKLDEMDSAREELLKLSRELKKKATLAISSIHTNNLSEAERMLKESEKILKNIETYRKYEIFYPITRESMQELIEASVFFKIVSEGRLEIPDLDDKVHPSSILTGVADVAGELRRYILDVLRKSEIEEAEKLIQFMERIYFSLVSFSYPDRIVPGLKGKIDMVRLSLERVKSDLISAMVFARERESFKR
jgi:translin